MEKKKFFKKIIKLRERESLLFFFVIVIYFFPNFIYPQILYVPFFSQRDGRWSSDTLGSCTGCTIGSDGCATTSKAMVFNYFHPNYTDLGQLNTYLLDNGGYAYNSQDCVGYCLIPWDDKNNIGAPHGVTFTGHFTDNLFSRINSELLKGYPVIVKVHSASISMHFVVITGKYGSTYYINDPYDSSYQCRTLNNGYFGNYIIDAIWLFRGPIQIPLSGDWDGDGEDTFGYFENNVFYLDNEQTVPFGIPGDYPIIGDWDGDGSDDIGVFRAKEEGVDQSTFHLELLNDGELGGLADYVILFGYCPDDIPLVGDWDGNGDDDIGSYNPPTSTFNLYKVDLNTSTATSYKDIPLGQSCDIPITGDWDCDGDDDLGVFRSRDPNENTNNFYFDIDFTGDQAEYDVISFGSNGYGDIGDMPVIGDWDGDGDDNIGVYRPSDPGSTLDKFHTNSGIPDINVCNNPPNTPSAPSGPNSGDVGTSYNFSTSATDPDGDSLEYRFDWGDGNISSWASSTQSHIWKSAGDYTVKAQAKDSHGATSPWSAGKTIEIYDQHTVSTPNTPSGIQEGETDTPYTYTTGGSSCSQGHIVEYKFDWGDETYSVWSSSTSASHSWPNEGTYEVKAQARCSVDTNIVSDWSQEKSVTISRGITQYNLTISATTGGTTNPSPETYAYDSGTQVEVTSVQDSGSTFSHWSGDVPAGHENDNPITITMDSDKSITANFSLNTYTLTTQVEPSGAGTVNRNPENEEYNHGESVELTANAVNGYSFFGWTGDVPQGHEEDNPLTIIMDSDKSVTANFNPITYTISGTVKTEEGEGIVGVIITFSNEGGTATTDSGGSYSHTVEYGWSGTATPTKNEYTFSPSNREYINLTSDQLHQDYTGTLIQYTLTIDAGSGGTTEPSPGSYTHDSGTQVSIKAIPDSGYEFSRWSGDASGKTNPITIIMDSDKSITAKFGKCFIATAAYSSHSHPHVKILRDFRDKYLMPNKVGRAFVNSYHKYSPFIADFISKHKIFKFVVRINLLPFVAFSYSMVHFGPIITTVLLVFISVFPAFLILFSRRKLRRVEARYQKALAS